MFDDRVTFYLSYCRRVDRRKVLGHILAHEIVHVLEGTGRHSDTGLMKVRWTAQDLHSMTGIGLGLAAEDWKLLRMPFLPTLAGMGTTVKDAQDQSIRIQIFRLD